MSEDNQNQQQQPKHQDDQEHKISSTQIEDEQQNVKSNDAVVDISKPKEKIVTPLPTTTVKPSSSFKLSSFTGDDSKVNIINWIRMYENMATRVGWSDEEMKWNLSSYLDEEAFDYYVEHVLAEDQDWKQAKQSMLIRFDQFDPYVVYVSYKWTPQIELKEYLKKMRALGFAKGLKEEEILKGLARGLPAHIRSDFASVTSLQQWFSIASLIQQRLEEGSVQYYNNKNNNKNNQSWRNGSRRGDNRPHNNNNHQRQSGGSSNRKPRMSREQTVKSEYQLQQQNSATANEQNEA